MKKYILLILFLTSLNLFSQFNEPIMINQPEEDIYFAGEQAVKIFQDRIYLTFYQKETNCVKIIFALSENHGPNFDFFEVDEMPLTEYVEYIYPPILEILSDGTIIILYLKRTIERVTLLYKALSYDNGQSFVTEEIAENVTGEIQIINQNDILELIYRTGSPNQLSYYQHFTDTEKSENEDGGPGAAIMKFWGLDVLNGPVHSNDRIWIYQSDGGNNNGWPTFNGIVTTSDYFIKYPSGVSLIDYGAPMAEIFRGGWRERVEPIELVSTATDIRQNGIRPFDPSADIVYVQIDGSGFTSMQGYRELVRIDSFEVYSWFPADSSQVNAIINIDGNWFEDAEHIWTNHIPIYETVWEQGPSDVVSNQSVWVESELWIEGILSGIQTWGCADTVYIVGDITYEGTTPGAQPDDPDDLNLTDFFGLVSEKRILVKYKHIDPETGELMAPNCNSLYMYGAFAAIGKGDEALYGEMACHHDGIFSFEYQHPHGSTPDFESISPYSGNDTVYTFIDFHKYIFPGNDSIPEQLEGFVLHGAPPPDGYPCGYDYESSIYLNSYPNNSNGVPGYNYETPYGTDYPWYNPVWPEERHDIIYERGTIHIFGSLIQRRRGFVHRSGSDPYNHGYYHDAIWDLENFLYDGTHPSTGYAKDYNYDSRLSENILPDFPPGDPVGFKTLVISRSENGGQDFEEITGYDINYNHEYPLIILEDNNEECMVMAIQDSCNCVKLMASYDNGFTFENLNTIEFNEESIIELRKMALLEDNLYLWINYHFSYSNQERILRYSLLSNELSVLNEYDSISEFNDFEISNTGEKVYISYCGVFNIYYSLEGETLDNVIQWEPWILSNEFDEYKSVTSIAFDDGDSLFIFFNQAITSPDSARNLYMASGYIEGITPVEQNTIESPKITLINYPNPFNAETTFEFRIASNILPEENIKLVIYNVKGQKIKTLECLEGINRVNAKATESLHHITWDGRDENGKKVSSGIYFYCLEIKGKTETAVKMVLLK